MVSPGLTLLAISKLPLPLHAPKVGRLYYLAHVLLVSTAILASYISVHPCGSGQHFATMCALGTTAVHLMVINLCCWKRNLRVFLLELLLVIGVQFMNSSCFCLLVCPVYAVQQGMPSSKPVTVGASSLQHICCWSVPDSFGQTADACCCAFYS